ncbi:phosphoribosyltransferase [Dehalococcoides mccartyi]|uniref:phosphoribosyltransferase n=1 Tax=Dehalococcoides mccartyi TaxID=61435 RepID=UPI002FC58F5E
MMHRPLVSPIFENRFDAGRQLAEKLTQYKDKSAIVLAIPNGGIPIATQVALALDADMDMIISRKLPIPLRPEGGFGAVADDGAVMLNHEVVNYLKMTEQQIHYTVNKVRAEVQQRSLLYRGHRTLSILNGRTAIIIDDGLASGYTMLAAIESVRRKKPARIVAAVPAASATARKLVEKAADEVITVADGFMPKFYVSDYYRYWNVLDDEQGLKVFQDWQMRRQNLNLRPENLPPPSMTMRRKPLI